MPEGNLYLLPWSWTRSHVDGEVPREPDAAAGPADPAAAAAGGGLAAEGPGAEGPAAEGPGAVYL